MTRYTIDARDWQAVEDRWGDFLMVDDVEDAVAGLLDALEDIASTELPADAHDLLTYAMDVRRLAKLALTQWHGVAL